jgi:hypothetical protein
MAKGGHALSRDANLCASCSSMADGMSEESATASLQRLAPQSLSSPSSRDRLHGIESAPSARLEPSEAESSTAGEEIVIEWKGGRLRKRE